MKISAAELARRADVTYRRVDYWIRKGVILQTRQKVSGSGHSYEFDEECVEKVRLLGVLSDYFGGRLRTEILAQIYIDYDIGSLEIGRGIMLVWEDKNNGGE